MNCTIGPGDTFPIELRFKGTCPVIPNHEGACLRVLGEEEVIELLRDRLGKSTAEVRQVLESYDRAAAQA